MRIPLSANFELFTNADNAIVIDKNSTDPEHIELLNKGFWLIEYPNYFPFEKVKEIVNLMDACIKEYDAEIINLTLRIKKLGKQKKMGMYAKVRNTIILDPRHTYVWRHELGHDYHTLMKMDDIDFEEFANKF